MISLFWKPLKTPTCCSVLKHKRFVIVMDHSPMYTGSFGETPSFIFFRIYDICINYCLSTSYVFFCSAQCVEPVHHTSLSLNQKIGIIAGSVGGERRIIAITVFLFCNFTLMSVDLLPNQSTYRPGR